MPKSSGQTRSESDYLTAESASLTGVGSPCSKGCSMMPLPMHVYRSSLQTFLGGPLQHWEGGDRHAKRRLYGFLCLQSCQGLCVTTHSFGEAVPGTMLRKDQHIDRRPVKSCISLRKGERILSTVYKRGNGNADELV